MELSGKRVLVFGAGRSGQGAASLLLAAGASPVLYDGQYYIFRSVDSYDETETAMRRQSLQTKRLQDIVSEACAVYQKKHMVTMDPGKWEQVVKQAGFPYSGENFFSAVKEALENEGI